MLEVVSAKYDQKGAEDASASLEAYYPEHVLAFAAKHGTRVVPLAPGVSYCISSVTLSKIAPHLDTCPSPPAGLYVIAEKTAYLRKVNDLAVVHEFAHALDRSLGEAGGYDGYLSFADQSVREAFHVKRGFTTPYAASALDEFFAESVRAYVEANSDRCPWPKATRERLLAVNPAMYEIVERLFERMATAMRAEQLSFALGWAYLA
ncbi:MAG: hypothetical protein EPN48_18255 [Microbacteriaceae bacterium]|nr:MAG: hypothetical protein EPN48_18255 [Microbacteriaceae bacterium]